MPAVDDDRAVSVEKTPCLPPSLLISCPLFRIIVHWLWCLTSAVPPSLNVLSRSWLYGAPIATGPVSLAPAGQAS
jgi:hypothetical protein